MTSKDELSRILDLSSYSLGAAELFPKHKLLKPPVKHQNTLKGYVLYTKLTQVYMQMGIE